MYFTVYLNINITTHTLHMPKVQSPVMPQAILQAILQAIPQAIPQAMPHVCNACVASPNTVAYRSGGIPRNLSNSTEVIVVVIDA